MADHFHGSFFGPKMDSWLHQNSDHFFSRLVGLGDEILITKFLRDYFISHYKDPYYPTRMQWNVPRVLITVQL